MLIFMTFLWSVSKQLVDWSYYQQWFIEERNTMFDIKQSVSNGPDKRLDKNKGRQFEFGNSTHTKNHRGCNTNSLYLFSRKTIKNNPVNINGLIYHCYCTLNWRFDPYQQTWKTKFNFGRIIESFRLQSWLQTWTFWWKILVVIFGLEIDLELFIRHTITGRDSRLSWIF